MIEAIKDKKWLVLGLVAAAIYTAFWCLYNLRFMVVSFASVAFLLLLALAAVAAGIFKLKDQTLFLVVLIVMGLLFCFATSPMGVPDEPWHYASTYWLADGITGKGSLTSSADGILMRGEDWLLFKRSSVSIRDTSYLNVIDNFSWLCTNESERVWIGYNFRSLVGVNASAKIFTVCGLLLGKALHLGAYPTFYLGRIGSLAFYVFAAYTAFKMAPKGKSVIALVALLPMSLHIGASYSYDSGIIAYSFLVFGFLMRGFYGEDGSIGIKHVLIYGVVVALLAPCKVVYSLLGFLGLLVPRAKFTSEKLAKYSKFAFVFVVVFAAVILRLSTLSGFTKDTAVLKRGMEVGHPYTLSWIISHPVGSFKVFLQTLDAQGDFYLFSTVGYSLGWFQGNLQFPKFLMVPYLLLGALCLFKSKDEDSALPGKTSLAFVCTALLIAGGIILSMWLGWTFLREGVIQGVQGRYFTPFLPVLLYGLRGSGLPNKFSYAGKTANLVIYGACTLNLLFLIRFFSYAAMG